MAFIGNARAEQFEEWPSGDFQLTLFPEVELSPTGHVTLASYCDEVPPSPTCGDPCCGDGVCSQEVEFAQTLSKMASFWSKFDVSGHVRVRQGTDFERIGRPTRNRQRLRARLALIYTANEEIKAGIRWTTGDRKLVLEPGDRRGSPLSYKMPVTSLTSLNSISIAFLFSTIPTGYLAHGLSVANSDTR